MKKKKVTYGVYNLVEWYAILRMGKASVKVPFTGGAITTQGITPATFTTSNPVIQFAIENSPEFKKGKIKIVRNYALKGEVEIERNAPKPISSDKAKTEAGENGIANIPNDEAQCVKTASDDVAIEEDTVTEAQPDDKEAEVHTALRQVEFDCNDDAKDFLEQNFGFTRSKLHNREDIIAAGKSKGVDISFA